jgi:hypothetical protein
MSRPPSSERAAKIKNVIRVSSGNFLEMYDFIVFGYYAGAIGQAFFPGHNPYGGGGTGGRFGLPGGNRDARP